MTEVYGQVTTMLSAPQIAVSVILDRPFRHSKDFILSKSSDSSYGVAMTL